MTSTALSSTFIQDLYTRMLLTRTVGDYARRLHEQSCSTFVASSRGYEAAQVGSAVCIELGKDFTLPYYRDLGVLLTIGMTPYEVFRTYIQTQQQQTQDWGYHKHNIVSGSAPVATQLLHAAGIAFACKLRKAGVVTIAYCDDTATSEGDFLESIHFAAQQQLPIVFVYERDCTHTSPLSNPHEILFPTGLTHQHVDGTDIIAVYKAMSDAMEQARGGHGPTILEMCITASNPALPIQQTNAPSISVLTSGDMTKKGDPLVHCQDYLQKCGAWDEEWAAQVSIRISTEVERAMHDAIHDSCSPEK